MLTLLLFNMVGTTLFIHSHSIDGTKIVHSHPFAGTAASHSHSAASLDVISRTIITEALTPSEISFDSIATLTISGATQRPTLGYDTIYTCQSQLRAPPVVSML